MRLEIEESRLHAYDDHRHHRCHHLHHLASISRPIAIIELQLPLIGKTLYLEGLVHD